MKTIQKISTPALILTTALALSACGGGGDGGGPAPIQDAAGGGNGGGNSTLQKLTGVNGFKIDYQGASPSPTTWQGSITSPISYTSATSLSNFTVTDNAAPAHSANLPASGLSAGTFVNLSGTQLGGTTYQYSRFGWLYGANAIDANNSTSWYTPFAVANATPQSPASANYAGRQQALVYLQADQTSALSGSSGWATCDTSATYTASNKSLQLTLSNCTTGVSFIISGSITLANGAGSTTLTAVKLNGVPNPTTVTTSSVNSGNFLLAGPNGEELVGAVTTTSSIALSDGTGSSNPAKFLVIFGVKKS
jgi:hypothetical protein